MPQLETVFSDLNQPEERKVAALDIGSNSFHLVVARIVSGSVQILHRVKQKVRLADGLDANNLLDDAAIERGLETLGIVADSLKGFSPDSVRIVATHTLRRATNARQFIRAARTVLPYPIEVISGAEEARLIYLGVAHTNHDEGQRLVVDIGGGSTECIIGEGFQPMLLRSMQMGCVSYTNCYFPDGELKAKAFNRAITAARQQLEMVEKKYLQLGWQTAIGTSGTIKTIAMLCKEIGDVTKDNWITSKGLKKLIKECCDKGHVDKLSFTELAEERRPVFAAGLAILSAIFDALDIKEMEYSPAALREGVLYEMEDRLAHQDIRERTADSLAARYQVDIEQAKRVLATTLHIYQQIAHDWQIETEELRSMLAWAALLHEVGLQIHTRGVQRHSAYILQNVELPGFNQEQQNLLATLVRFHRKKIRIEELPEFTEYSQTQVIQLLFCLRLGVLLNIKRQDDFVPELELKLIKKAPVIAFPEQWLESKPLINADLLREAEYQSAVGIKLTVEEQNTH